MLKVLALLGYVVSGAVGDGAHHSMQLSCPALQKNKTIPVEFTCNGQNHSLPLRWSRVPGGTQTMVVIMEDADSNHGYKHHWGLYNIPPRPHQLANNQHKFQPDEKFALNSWGTSKYCGPCSSAKEHNYIIRLYALDAHLKFFEKNVTIEQLEDAMVGHIVDVAQLKGHYP